MPAIHERGGHAASTAGDVTDDEPVRGPSDVAERHAGLGIAQPATHSRARDAATPLKGRRGETEALDHLLKAIRSGASRALVMRGEPGIGKTALLEYLVRRAAGCRVARAAGVESEMELAFAGLHQLLAPMLDRLEHLPVPQRDALQIAFGLSPGSGPDRFFVALAVLSLLADAAEDQPLICVVDDAQWLDGVSAQGPRVRRALRGRPSERRHPRTCRARRRQGTDQRPGARHSHAVHRRPLHQGGYDAPELRKALGRSSIWPSS